MTAPVGVELPDRFRSKFVIEADSGCWLWTASRWASHARFWDGQRMTGAHAWAYEALVGPLPEGIQLHHLCGVGHCVNPAHLEPLTSKQHPGRKPSPEAERFWAKVSEDPGGCWLWTGGRNTHGYGQFWTPRTQSVGAHRWAYEFLVGPIPDGLEIDHLCRVRHCVNPDHLEPVTNAVNNYRGVGFAALNRAKTHCKRGHEFTPENTIPVPGGRNCRACHQIRDRINGRAYRIRLAAKRTESARAAK